MSSKAQVDRRVASGVVARRVIPGILASAGADGATERGMGLLSELFELVLQYIARIAGEYGRLGGRQRANTIDLYQTLIDIRADFVQLIQYAQAMRTRAMPTTRLHVDRPVARTAAMGGALGGIMAGAADVKGIWTFAERPKYVYEHCPPFPPVHTFKKTAVKGKREEDRGVLLLNKAEQVRLVEKSLVKVLRATDSLPEYAHY